MATRRTTAGIAVILVAGLIAWDLASSPPPDIFAAPPLIALGSGAAATGAHCAALPTN